MTQNGITFNISARYQSITLMSDYDKKSIEVSRINNPAVIPFEVSGVFQLYCFDQRIVLQVYTCLEEWQGILRCHMASRPCLLYLRACTFYSGMVLIIIL